MSFFTAQTSGMNYSYFYTILAMRCARNDPEVRHRLVNLLIATGQEKEALRVRLSALLSLENVDPRRIYNQIVKIAEVFSPFLISIFFDD